MNQGRLVFAQIMDWFPRHQFDQIVSRWRGNHRVRNFSCMDQFLVMAFAQLTSRERLRDIKPRGQTLPRRIPLDCGAQ